MDLYPHQHTALDGSRGLCAGYAALLVAALAFLTRYYFAELVRRVQHSIAAARDVHRAFIQAGLCYTPVLAMLGAAHAPAPALLVHLPAEVAMLALALGVLASVFAAGKHMSLNRGVALRLLGAAVVAAVGNALCCVSSIAGVCGLVVGAGASSRLVQLAMRARSRVVLAAHYQSPLGEPTSLYLLRPLLYPFELVCDNLCLVESEKAVGPLFSLKTRALLAPGLGLGLLVLCGRPALSVVGWVLVCAGAAGCSALLWFAARRARGHGLITAYAFGVVACLMHILFGELIRVARSAVESHGMALHVARACVLAPATVVQPLLIHLHFSRAGFKRVSLYSLFFMALFLLYPLSIWSYMGGAATDSAGRVLQRLSFALNISQLATLQIYTFSFHGRILKESAAILMAMAATYFTAIYLFSNQ